MNERRYSVVGVTGAPLVDRTAEIQIFPFKSFDTDYGTDKFDKERAERFAKNFNEGVRGVDLATNFEHCLDSSKGHQASGWYKSTEVKDDGLYGVIEFTEDAAKEIAEGKWKYFSPEWFDQWTDTDGKKHVDVLVGGALTNKPIIKGQQPINFSEVAAEVADLEHSEPGEVEPRTDENDKTSDDDRGGPDRRDTPPDLKDSEDNMRLEEELRKILSLKDGDDVLAAVKAQHEELEPLRLASERAEKQKAFAEAYPEEAERLRTLTEANRNSEARAFSEQFKMFTDADGKSLNKGFPGVVLNKLEEVHKLFSEGKATPGDLKGVLDLVAAQGVVEYSEGDGSSRVGDNDNDNDGDPIKQFSEKITEIMTADNLSRGQALAEASKRHPELARAYSESMAKRGVRA